MKTIQVMKHAKRVMPGVIASVLLGMAAIRANHRLRRCHLRSGQSQRSQLARRQHSATAGRRIVRFQPLDSVPPGPMPEPPYGTTYTLTFKASEQPASLVAIPGEVLSYTYTTGDSGDSSFPDTLKIEFRHERYAGGVEAELPGPVSDFAIAIIRRMTGARPAFLQPSADPTWPRTSARSRGGSFQPPRPTSPSGLKSRKTTVKPPSSTSSFRTACSTLGPRCWAVRCHRMIWHSFPTVTRLRPVSRRSPEPIPGPWWRSSSPSIRPPTSSPTSSTTRNPRRKGRPPPSPARNPASNRNWRHPEKVTKRLTVGEAPALSLLTTRRTVPVRRRVTLYGWAKYGSIGQTVSLKQQYLGRRPP